MRYTVDHFESDKGDFVLDPLTDWEPVEQPEYWSDVVPTASSSHNTGCVVLRNLQTVKMQTWQPEEETFITVQSRHY